MNDLEEGQLMSGNNCPEGGPDRCRGGNCWHNNPSVWPHDKRIAELEADLRQAEETAAFWKAGYERDVSRVEELETAADNAHVLLHLDDVEAACDILLAALHPQPTESEE